MSSFGPNEKLYLSFGRRFTLSKVPKLRSEVTERKIKKFVSYNVTKT